MGSTPEEKFKAAVKVIQSLPKKGSFQPSHALMLQFYGYFKQATEGQCRKPKPSFWDVVNKAKWEAWHSLGDMPKEEAMLKYVEELKKIVETMPQTTMVAEFVEKLGSFYEIVEDASAAKMRRDIEALAARTNGVADSGSDASEPDEALAEHGAAQSNGHTSDEAVRRLIQTGERLLKRGSGNVSSADSTPTHSQSQDQPLGPTPRVPAAESGLAEAVEVASGWRSEELHPASSSEDEFCDTSEQMQLQRDSEAVKHVTAAASYAESADPRQACGPRTDRGYVLPSLQAEKPQAADEAARGRQADDDFERQRATYEALSAAVLRLQQDLCCLSERLSALEARPSQAAGASWWRQLGLSGRGLVLVLGWPLALHLLYWLLRARRRR